MTNSKFDDSRRRFLLRLTVLGGALFAPEAAKAAVRWTEVGPPTPMKPGAVKRIVLPVAYNQEVVYLTGSRQGTVAFSARCTHKGCVVAWDESKSRFLCPCHGGQFDQTGKNVAGPPPAPLRRLKTRIHRGRLLVEAPPLTDSPGD